MRLTNEIIISVTQFNRNVVLIN